ncbi:MAG: hypothetical protein NC337_09410 [Roseburia sp.]|nr:hypothetical protein [Roseburia sp.]
MDIKRGGRIMAGIMLMAAAVIMIPIEAVRGNIWLTMSGICFGIGGIQIFLENRKNKNVKNKEDLQ